MNKWTQGCLSTRRSGNISGTVVRCPEGTRGELVQMAVKAPVSQELRGEVLDKHLDRVADQLTRKYADRTSPNEVHAAVFDEASRYEHARVTQFIPVLVQHAVQERLRRQPARPHLASSINA
ncbi:MAG TPA: hypothetical protein VIL94_03785 [Acidothermaceae bacterium]